MSKTSLIPAAALILFFSLGGCVRNGDIMSSGVVTSYSPCPPAAIPAPAGDVTLFDPAGSRDSTAIDVVATISNLRATCTDSGENLVTTATFDVFAQRRDTRGARTVTLPYFATVVQGGANVVAKRTGQIVLQFADGSNRAQASSQASSFVNRAIASLPDEMRARLNAPRRAGDLNAALDPMSDPEVRQAVERTRHELLVGFELTPDQLRYNATR